MPEPEGIVCEVNLGIGALPFRNETIAKREEADIYRYSQYLVGGSVRGREPAPKPTTHGLLTALASSDPFDARPAAFLIGRCKAGDPAADARLTAALEPAMRQQASAILRVEAAMSAALRGKREPAQAILRELAQTAPIGDNEPWIAAAYLAQLGDAGGWPNLIDTLGRSHVEHYRLMALQAVAAFIPLAGTKVGEAVVDPATAVASRVEDAERMVRAEVPRMLVLVKHPRVRELLDRMATSDADENVRTQARAALQGL